MKIVFASNFFNHHQSSLSDEFYRRTGGEYRFISTETIQEERIKMGWSTKKAPYVMQYNETAEICQDLIDNADVVILGNAPMELIKRRLKEKKLTFLYSERIYKRKYQWYKWAIRTWRFFWRFSRYKNLYMLCASAYTAGDYAKNFAFINKAFKWGYFTEVKKYDDIEKILEWKHPVSILWVARLIEWKHPELPILIAKRLKEDGYNFEMNIIGNGRLESSLTEMISNYNLEKNVRMLGSMPPQEVRERMEQSEIFMFTSDRNEGWGAVLNESMNSACAVVASHAIGSVPYLIKDNENGLIYKDGDEDDLYDKVKFLLDNPSKRIEFGKKAYETMLGEWNAEVSAERLIKISKKILSKENTNVFLSGPVSKAKVIRDNWYK